MKLKEFIQENKSEFDTEKMSAKADVSFEKLLNKELHQPKNKKVLYLKYISIAACFAVVFSVGFWFVNHQKSSSIQKELLANLQDSSAGKRLEGVYAFNDEYKKRRFQNYQ